MSDAPPPVMFSEPPRERSFPTAAVAIAAVAVVILVAVLLLMSHRKPETVQLDAGYAPNLVVSAVKVSQSDTMPGAKVTYVEGHIQNNGPATVQAATVQVTFSNDAAMPPEVETRSLRLIRIRTPEIDTVPVSTAPIAPGAGADFYLIFENVNSNWNEQTPAVRVTGVQTK